MKVEIVKLAQYSGRKTTFYSAIVDDEADTFFDVFLEENSEKFFDEIEDILLRIELMANETGARRAMFKENEGSLGDLVCALYDSPHSRLRLYCIRLGSTVVILCGGGHKPKTIRALQEDKKLTKENKLMRIISKQIATLTKEKEIFWSNNGMELLGNLTFDTDE
jgi:hypothetical protein